MELEKTSTSGSSGETNAAVNAATEETKTEESTPAPASEQKIDYKAELEKNQSRLSQAEHIIVKLKREKKEEEESFVDNEDIEEKVNEAVDKKLNILTKDLVGDVVESALDAFSTDPDERELIKFHYENSLRPSGVSRTAILADLRRAKLLANESALLSENEELKEALKSKRSISNVGMGSNQQKATYEEGPKFSEAELALLRRRGIDPKKVKIEIK